MTEVTIRGETTINQVPMPRPSVKRLLKTADVIIPQALPYTDTRVYTRRGRFVAATTSFSLIEREICAGREEIDR